MDDTQSRHGGAKVKVPPPLVYLGGLAAGLLVGWIVRPFPVPLDFVPRQACGIGICLIGLALILAALRWFSRTGQAPEPWKPSPELIFHGPYRFTRNPMYLGMLLLQSALGVVFDNLWAVLLAPVALFVVHHIAVLPEERYLTARFGEPYVRYTTQVRRYL